MIESVRLSGRVLDQYRDALEEAEDGDVWIRPQLDAAGRFAVSGRHANSGYSGYFVLALHTQGARRRFLETGEIFPLGENGYAAQKERDRAESEVSSRIHALKGAELAKVTGGWKFVDGASVISKMVDRLSVVSKELVVLKPLGLNPVPRLIANPVAKDRIAALVRSKRKPHLTS